MTGCLQTTLEGSIFEGHESLSHMLQTPVMDASGDFNRKYKPKGGRFAHIYDFLMIVICF